MAEEEDTLLNSLAEAAAAEKAKEEPAAEVADEEPEEGAEPDNAIEEIDKEEVSEKDEEAVDEDAPEADEEVKPTRKSASDTIRALKAERNEERTERERLISENATLKARGEFENQQKYAAQSAADRRAEEERLSLLDPSERRVYESDQRSRNLEHRINLMQMQMQDSTDRAVFQSQSTHDPLIAKYKDQVEAMLVEDRKKGFSASREEYLNVIVGRAVRADAAAKLSGKKDSAKKRIDKVTSKPASAKGDVAVSKKGKSEEDRLRGMLI